MVVVFPAPFGPRYPNISPLSTEKVTLSRTLRPEKSFCRALISMTGRFCHLLDAADEMCAISCGISLTILQTALVPK
jgi:hypothetical protein